RRPSRTRVTSNRRKASAMAAILQSNENARTSPRRRREISPPSHRATEHGPRRSTWRKPPSHGDTERPATETRSHGGVHARWPCPGLPPRHRATEHGPCGSNRRKPLSHGDTERKSKHIYVVLCSVAPRSE